MENLYQWLYSLCLYFGFEFPPPSPTHTTTNSTDSFALGDYTVYHTRSFCNFEIGVACILFSLHENAMASLTS